MDELEDRLTRVRKVFLEIQEMCQEYAKTEGDPFVLQAIYDKTKFGLSLLLQIDLITYLEQGAEGRSPETESRVFAGDL